MSKVANLPRGFEGEASYIRSLSGASQGTFFTQPGMTGLFYVYDQMLINGQIYLNTTFGTLIRVRFTIGSQSSSSSPYVNFQNGNWSGPMTCSVSGTGWQVIEWQVDWGAVFSGTITATAHSMYQMDTTV